MAHSYRKIQLNETCKVYSNWLVGAGFVSLLGFMILSGAKPNDGPSPARTPAQELATFQVEPGMKVQLVASEPMVQDPVIINFDEDGRLWVVEMRGFMPTIDGDGETERVGRLSVLEDKNGDGKMDISTVFLDKLVMPRAMALVPGGVLIAENGALWFAKDADGNLKADSKILIDSTYSRNGLPEHTDNGLWRGMDNWYYNAKSRLRYRLEEGKWLRDSTEFRGQWGMSHDDEGRLHYNYNWSQLHADLIPPNYLSKNKKKWKIFLIKVTLSLKQFQLKGTHPKSCVTKPSTDINYCTMTWTKCGRASCNYRTCNVFCSLPLTFWHMV